MTRTDTGHVRAKLRGLTGKGDAPRQIRGPTPKLGIDEIRQPPQKQPRCQPKTNHISGRDHRDAVPPCIEKPRQNDPERTTVERHAALPQLQDRGRVRQVVSGLVEKHIAKPPPKDHPKDHPKEQVFDLSGLHHRGVVSPQIGALHRHGGDPPAQQDAHDIGQRVPA